MGIRGLSGSDGPGPLSLLPRRDVLVKFMR